ncbi:ATP-binding protein, partial [Streptomyces cinereoruber]
GRGLLLVREIAQEAGGTCDVEHTASGGKIIWAALPLAPMAPGPGAVSHEPVVTSPRTDPSAP